MGVCLGRLYGLFCPHSLLSMGQIKPIVINRAGIIFIISFASYREAMLRFISLSLQDNIFYVMKRKCKWESRLIF